MIRNFFINLKKGTEHLNYGRPIITEWGRRTVVERLSRNDSTRRQTVELLDIGCGHGTDLLNIRSAVTSTPALRNADFTLKLHGIENYPPYIRECRSNGIAVRSLDIERDPFMPVGQMFDLVIANQVLEHTKELFWIVSEVTRILKPGGRFIVGVPNLASLHNRLLLLFGLHPTAQQSMSAHVRTFTRPDLRRFAESGGYLRFLEAKGSNFYPFPPVISKPLAALFPGMAWGLFMLFERTEKEGSFLECLDGDEVLETPFYGGPQNRAKPLRIAKKKGKR